MDSEGYYLGILGNSPTNIDVILYGKADEKKTGKSKWSQSDSKWMDFVNKLLSIIFLDYGLFGDHCTILNRNKQITMNFGYFKLEKLSFQF